MPPFKTSLAAAILLSTSTAFAQDLADYKTLVGYACADGSSALALYMGKGTRDYMALTLDGSILVELDVTISGSGVRYADDTLSWHTKAETAVLELGNETIICTETFAAVTPDEQAQMLADK